MVRKHKLSEIKEDIKLMRFDKKKKFERFNRKERDLLQNLLNITNFKKPVNAKGSVLKAFWEALRK